MSARITTENKELVTVRDAMRALNRLVDELETSERQKVVLTKHGRMRAVILSVECYTDLLGELTVERRPNQTGLTHWDGAKGEQRLVGPWRDVKGGVR